MTNGTWSQMNFQSLGMAYKTFLSYDLTRAWEIKYVTFDSAIQHDVGPGETIRGWVFFTVPEQNPSRLHFSFVDTKGTFYAPEPIRFPNNDIASPPSQPDLASGIDTNTQDISHFPLLK